jgi:hypothetical protein
MLNIIGEKKVKAELVSYSGQKEEIICTVEMINGKVVVTPADGLEGFLTEDEFIKVPGKKLSIKKDGEEFIKGLPIAFSGSYVRARIV